MNGLARSSPLPSSEAVFPRLIVEVRGRSAEFVEFFSDTDLTLLFTKVRMSLVAV